jgi:hypothetical protein
MEKEMQETLTRIDPHEYMRRFKESKSIKDLESPESELKHSAKLYLEAGTENPKKRELAIAGLISAARGLSITEATTATKKRMIDAGVDKDTAISVLKALRQKTEESRPRRKAREKPKHPDMPECYYDRARKEFMVRLEDGTWLNFTETQFKRYLKSFGFSTKLFAGQNISELDTQILKTQLDDCVSYSGELAGWVSGCHTAKSGDKILVTKGAIMIEPKPGEWNNLRAFYETLFGGNQDQICVFFGWLKVAISAMRKNLFRPGQCLAMTGKKGYGKSLCQLLITEMLGCRFARPYQFMAGKTPFNSDLFRAEHLAIEDDIPSVKINDRRAFGASIKEFTANQGQRLHAKGRDALMLDVFWRVTVTVNDEPENLMILPPIDPSLEDKIILLKTEKATVPCDTTTNEGRDKCWETLVNEIPFFLHWLEIWEIPEEYKSGRYGVTHYHHPEILDTLCELSPESKMEQLLQVALFSEPIKQAWNGTATDLEQVLTSHNLTGYEARKLLSFNTACGVYLGRLQLKKPNKYSKKHTENGNEWSIEPSDNLKGMKGFSELFSKNEHIKNTEANHMTESAENTQNNKTAENFKNPFSPFRNDTQPKTNEDDLSELDW